jgi:cytochrome c oxidase subunit 1
VNSYHLPAHSESLAQSARAWMLLGLSALVGAGFFSLMLVLARTPAVAHVIPLVDFFHVALVVHVNLSVLIWLLSLAGVFWSLSCRSDAPRWDRLSFWLAALGTLVVSLSPFLGAGDPLMNNYVPILRHPVFYAGMGLFTLGITLHLIRCALDRNRSSAPGALQGNDALRLAIRLSTLLVALALVAMLASLLNIPESIQGQAFFEFLFWGGGHVLQFNHALLMMVAWVVLASAAGYRVPLTPRRTVVLFVLLALPVVTVPYWYAAFEVTSAEHRMAFTNLMRFGGLFCLPIGLAVAFSWQGAARASGEQVYLRAALWSSMWLFALGGLLGYMIAGLDIVIPAHYHGSTVGVTIAFMGLCYYLLPRLGFGPVPHKLATWQPILYGGGQVMHILGLAWSGGYGVKRKTLGKALEASQGYEALGDMAAMGLMGLGGLLSVLGGLLFLVAAWRSVRMGRAARTARAAAEPAR